MKYIIGQLWVSFNLYLVNRGAIPIPYPFILIYDPIIRSQFVNFCHQFKKYPRIVQKYFDFHEEKYAKHPDLIPDSSITIPIIESDIKIGVKNPYTLIKRTTFTGKAIVKLAARRFSKTTDMNMSLIDILQVPFGKAVYSQHVYYGTRTDATQFFHLIKNQLELDGIEAKSTSTEGRITKRNNIIEYKYLTAEGENRGQKPTRAFVDEVGFISNAQLDKFMKAIDPSLRDNKANIIFLTSPAESLENTYITDLALNPDKAVTFMLPSFLNNAQTEAGTYITSPTDLIKTTKSLIDKNQKFMVKTTIFGIPLLIGGREIFIKPHFYVFNKRSLSSEDGPDIYNHLEHLKHLDEEEIKHQQELSDLRRNYGSPSTEEFSPIKYSFLVADLSFSGIGDYTVIYHVGVSVSGDIYILRIFRQPTVASEIDDILINFLLECLCSSHGSHLTRMYIEGKSADAATRIRNLQLLMKDFVEKKILPFENVSNYVHSHNGMSLPVKELKKRLSLKFGYINPKGGYFDDKKPANELLHGTTMDDTLFLSTSGSKIERARTAVSVLSRNSHITQEKIKIVFMCPYTEDYIVDAVLSEVLSMEALDLDQKKKKGSANAHDDAFDTLVYAILLSEKLNDSILRGHDITSRGTTVISGDGSLSSKKNLSRSIASYSNKMRQYNNYKSNFNKR